jgi:hypothetical protein
LPIVENILLVTAMTTVSSHLKTLFDTFEKSQTSKSSVNGKIKFFPFLPCDNDISLFGRGSYNSEEKKNDPLRNEDDSDVPKSAGSVVESESFIEWTFNALKQLLALPYLQFLR